MANVLIVGNLPNIYEKEDSVLTTEGGRVVRKFLETSYPNYTYRYIYAFPEPRKTRPYKKEITSEDYLKPFHAEIEEFCPDKILLLGAVAHAMFYREDVVKALRDIRSLASVQIISGKEVYVVTSISETNLSNGKSGKERKSMPEYFIDLAVDIKKLMEQDGPYDYQEPEIWIPSSIDILEDALIRFLSASMLSCDIETTDINQEQIDLIAVGFGAQKEDGEGVVLIVSNDLLRDERTKEILRNFFEEFDGELIFHNAKFDTRYLREYCKYDFSQYPPHDSMLLAYALDERSHDYRVGGIGLKFLSRLYFDIPEYEAFDWEEFYASDNPDWDALYKYLSIDTNATYLLYDKLRNEQSERKESGPDIFYENILRPAGPIFAEIESKGMLIDVPYLEDLKIQFEKEGERFSEVAEIYRSPKQLLSFLVDMGATIKDTNEKTLSALSATNSEIAQEASNILKFRELETLYGRFLLPLLEKRDSADRVHTEFWLFGTATGRLSSSNPNLQNIPKNRNDAIRRAFIAPKNHYFVSVDFSQLELRVMAYYSEDPNLLRIYNEGGDLHTRTAAKIFRKPELEITKEERNLAKILNFGIPYGRSAKGIVTGPEMQELRLRGEATWTYEEAEQALRDFFKEFPKLKKWLDEQHKNALRRGYVETEFGRRRRFPFYFTQDAWKVKNQAGNMPIQSTAGDILLNRLITLHDALPVGASIICTVHDDIKLEIHESVFEQTIPLIKNIMTDVPLKHKDRLPFEVDITAGRNWRDQENVSTYLS